MYIYIKHDKHNMNIKIIQKCVLKKRNMHCFMDKQCMKKAFQISEKSLFVFFSKFHFNNKTEDNTIRQIARSNVFFKTHVAKKDV